MRTQTLVKRELSAFKKAITSNVSVRNIAQVPGVSLKRQIPVTATHVKMEEPVENQTLVTSSAFADPAFRAMYVKLRWIGGQTNPCQNGGECLSKRPNYQCNAQTTSMEQIVRNLPWASGKCLT